LKRISVRFGTSKDTNAELEKKAKKRETEKRDRQRSLDAISDQQPLTHDEGSDANRHLVG
jgi:hypothetical protein